RKALEQRRPQAHHPQRPRENHPLETPRREDPRSRKGPVRTHRSPETDSEDFCVELLPRQPQSLRFCECAAATRAIPSIRSDWPLAAPWLSILVFTHSPYQRLTTSKATDLQAAQVCATNSQPQATPPCD